MIVVRRAATLAIVVAAAVLCAVSRAGAFATETNSYTLKAKMDAHHVVTPANRPWTPPTSVANARGRFSGTLTVFAGRRTLKWHVTYANVGTNPLQVVDIHLGRPGKFGQVLVRLCAPCKSGAGGTKQVTSVAAAEISSGDSWLTVITGKYPNGVIRGQIRAGSS